MPEADTDFNSANALVYFSAEVHKNEMSLKEQKKAPYNRML
jgi:hypothetical protein